MGGNSNIKGMETWKGGGLGEKAAGVEFVRGMPVDKPGLLGVEGFAEGSLEAAENNARWQRLAEESDPGLGRSPGVRLFGSSEANPGQGETDNGQALFTAYSENGEGVTISCQPLSFGQMPTQGQFFATYEGVLDGGGWINEDGHKEIEIALRIHDPSAPGGSRVEVYRMLEIFAREAGFLDEEFRPLSPENVRGQSILVGGPSLDQGMDVQIGGGAYLKTSEGRVWVDSHFEYDLCTGRVLRFHEDLENKAFSDVTHGSIAESLAPFEQAGVKLSYEGSYDPGLFASPAGPTSLGNLWIDKTSLNEALASGRLEFWVDEGGDVQIIVPSGE